jgi:hypothetical protein
MVENEEIAVGICDMSIHSRDTEYFWFAIHHLNFASWPTSVNIDWHRTMSANHKLFERGRKRRNSFEILLVTAAFRHTALFHDSVTILAEILKSESVTWQIWNENFMEKSIPHQIPLTACRYLLPFASNICLTALHPLRCQYSLPKNRCRHERKSLNQRAHQCTLRHINPICDSSHFCEIILDSFIASLFPGPERLLFFFLSVHLVWFKSFLKCSSQFLKWLLCRVWKGI